MPLIETIGSGSLKGFNPGGLGIFPNLRSQYAANSSSVVTGNSYFIKPDAGDAFEVFAIKQVSDLATVPGGSPSWLSNVRAIETISRSVVGEVDTQNVSYANFLRMVQEKQNLSSSGYTCYFYYIVIHNGTIWGATRTRFNNTFEQWRDAHVGDYNSGVANYLPDYVRAYWDAYHSTYTVTNVGATSTNTPQGIVRMIPYRLRAVDINANSLYDQSVAGLHYKREGFGEHYPWRNPTTNVCDTLGYFAPSGNVSSGVANPVPAGAIGYIGLSIT